MELFEIDVAQGSGSTELMGGQADLGKVLDCFGFHEGVR
jgi:hypothetical protein